MAGDMVMQQNIPCVPHISEYSIKNSRESIAFDWLYLFLFPVSGECCESSVSVSQERVGDVVIRVGIGLQNKALVQKFRAMGKRTSPTPRGILTSVYQNIH